MINEIIIVEGKSDTQKLKKVFGNDIKTIETNGLGINEDKLKLIKTINNQVGVIIFTDPDGPGKTIRETIINYIDGDIKNAFINKKSFDSNSKKIGIAEASNEEIKNALNNLITYNSNKTSITWKEYLKNDFFKKENRMKIIDHFNWDKDLNNKSFFKWLNWTEQTVESINKILGEI